MTVGEKARLTRLPRPGGEHRCECRSVCPAMRSRGGHAVPERSTRNRKEEIDRWSSRDERDEVCETMCIEQ